MQQVRKHIDYGNIILGEYAPEYRAVEVTKNLELLSHEFEGAGIPVRLSTNLGEARWKKLVWNVPFNGLSVVLNSTTDQLVSHSATRRLARDIMVEVIIGAGKCGYSIDEEYADDMLKATEQMAVYRPSMKLDFESGRPLEIETMYWRPVTEAESAGYIMIAVRTLARQLEYLNGKERE